MGGLLVAQVCFESVHPGLPRPLARLHPLDRVIERVGLHPAWPPLGSGAADDRPGAFEPLEVARDRWEAHRERFCQLVDGRRTLGEPSQDRPARWICQSGEREAELVGRHVTRRLINAAIKYKSDPWPAARKEPGLVARGSRGQVRRRLLRVSWTPATESRPRHRAGVRRVSGDLLATSEPRNGSIELKSDD